MNSKKHRLVYAKCDFFKRHRKKNASRLREMPSSKIHRRLVYAKHYLFFENVRFAYATCNFLRLGQAEPDRDWPTRANAHCTKSCHCFFFCVCPAPNAYFFYVSSLTPLGAPRHGCPVYAKRHIQKKTCVSCTRNHHLGAPRHRHSHHHRAPNSPC